MPRRLAMERVFSLSQYNTLRVTDEIVLPDELAYNEDIVNEIRYLQVLGAEQSYYTYKKTVINLGDEVDADTEKLPSEYKYLNLILGLKTATIEKIKELSKGE